MKSEIKNVDQFPSQEVKGKVPHTKQRLLSFDQFISKKFDNKTIEKEAMSGSKEGKKGQDTLENDDYEQK